MPDENLMATRDDETIRLQRKRARDRNSQRQARERTKKRLASMESLINQMTDRDATGSIAALVQELTEVKEERDRLAKALDDVTKIATSHRALRPSRDNLDYDASTGIEQNACDTSDDINHDWLFNTGSLLSQDEPLGGAFCSDFQQDLGCQTMPEELGLLGSGTGSPGISSFQKAGLNEDSGFCGTTGQSDGDMQQVEHVANSSAPTFDIIVPPSETMCDCNPNEVIPLNHDGYQKSLWRTANETLLKTFELGSDINHTDEEMSDDIPVRAVLEGWDTVLKHWGMAQLPPAWQILRRVDEALFARDSGQVERLAILRILYLRLAFLREPTVARLVKIPPWYHRRPSQDIPHSCAIDFIAWPGIRERFIFQQHRYCSNFYWKTFAANMRILWPFSFRDSYMSPGNRFQVSPLFDNCISDIKCWAMGPDLFSQYPELCSDIPAASQTPRGVSAETQLRLAHSPHRQPTAQNLTNSAKVVNAHSHEREDAQHVYSETSYFESSEHHSSLLDGDGTVFPLDTSPSFDLFYQLYENMPSTEVS